MAFTFFIALLMKNHVLVIIAGIAKIMVNTNGIIPSRTDKQRILPFSGGFNDMRCLSVREGIIPKSYLPVAAKPLETLASRFKPPLGQIGFNLESV